jgi:hypothetical protein
MLNHRSISIVSRHTNFKGPRNLNVLKNYPYLRSPCFQMSLGSKDDEHVSNSSLSNTFRLKSGSWLEYVLTSVKTDGTSKCTIPCG